MTTPLHARPAIIDSYDPKTNKIVYRFTDMDVSRKFTTYAPHPYASNGWGIFVGPTSKTRLMMTHSSMSQHIPVGVIPQSAYSQLDFGGTADVSAISVSERQYPHLNPGDIVLQSLAGSRVKLTQYGIELTNGGETFVKHNAKTNTSLEYFKNKYENTEAHRHISGAVLRDMRTSPRAIERDSDKLLSIDYDYELSVIGRNPIIQAQALTTKSSIASEAISFRNPALAEHRTLVYEYALKDMTDDFGKEVERLASDSSREFLNQPYRRDMQRTDVLNLGMHLPNILFENIIGTTVDIYGNVLDLNRNKIQFPTQDVVGTTLDSNLSLLRRSIKYHFEINSRKIKQIAVPPILDALPPRPNTNDDGVGTGYSHSRFFTDIDGEGQLKINIPASSNTGNVPLLSRYINSYDTSSEATRNSGSFRDEKRVDVQHFGFGVGNGISLDPEYAPTDILSPNRVAYRTAYHDILNTVSEAGLGEVITSDIRNSISDPAANAGGRSVHANLDGSLEINIGRDVIDKKSVVIDTAGSVVSRIGMDKNSHSVLSQMDGNVYVQVGGSTVGSDQQNESPVVKIFVKVKSADNDKAGFHVITLDSEGIHLESSPDTDIEVKSGGDLKLTAEGQTLLSGSTIAFYGKDGQRLLLPTGMEIK